MILVFRVRLGFELYLFRHYALLPSLVVSLLDSGLGTCFLIEAINVNKKKKNESDVDPPHTVVWHAGSVSVTQRR